MIKQATWFGISISTILYMLCGLLGYAAFGGEAPENILTEFGFFQPLWLVNLANLCVIIHVTVSYQLFCKPIYGLVEHWASKKWPNSIFINGKKTTTLGHDEQSTFTGFRLIYRTTYVILTFAVAMTLPFFSEFLGILGAVSFWPLTVYFPIQMLITKDTIPRFSVKWISLQIINFVFLVISLLAVAGSIHGLVKSF